MIQQSGSFKKLVAAAAILTGIGLLMVVASQVMVRTGKGLGEAAGWLTPAGILVIFGGGGSGAWLFLRLRRAWHAAQDAANAALAESGTTLLLAPRSALMRDEKVHDLWRRLSVVLKRTGDLPGAHLAWEVTGDRDRMAFLMRIPQAMLRGISGELAREFPELEISVLPARAEELPPASALFVDPPLAAAASGQIILWQNLVLARSAAYPIFTSDKAQGQLTALMGAVNIAHPQARVGYQFLVRKALPATAQGWLAEAGKLVPKARPGQPAPKVAPETQALIQAIQARAQEPAFDLVVRCWAAAASEQVAAGELGRISEALIAETVAAGPANQFVPGQAGKDPRPVWERHFPPETPVQVTASELGAFLHLPGQRTAEPYPRLVVSAARRLPPAPALVVRDEGDLSAYRILGHYEHPTGDVDLVGQPALETRKHTYGVGPTGSGKSVAMINSIISDFMGERAGVLMIEPSGDVPVELVAGLPPEALNDVVLLAPNDVQPFALNMCAVGLEHGLTAAVKNALGAIQMGMGANWATSVRMQQLITHGLYVVVDVLSRPEQGGASLMALSKFLQNEAYRDTLLVNCSLQAMGAKEFWLGDFSRWADREKQDAISVALRRLSEWIGNPEIRRTMSMPTSTVNLAELLGTPLGDDSHRPKIVMLPLTSPDTKPLVGALFVAYFTSVIMGRHRIPPEQRRPAKLYVDEFADFVNTSGGDAVKTLLAQARKFGAGVTLLTQGQGQIPKDVQVELSVNTLTKFFYATTSPDEARLAVRQMAGAVGEYDMMRIPPYHAYVKIGNHSPALVRMLPPARYRGTQPPLQTGFATRPPPEWRQLIQATAPFARFARTEVAIPQAAVDALAAPDLLAWANREAQRGDPEALVRRVANLAEADFAALYETRRQYDRWRAAEVAHNPGLIPDPLERVRWRSRWLYGIPWWLSDAQFLRLLNATAGEGNGQAADGVEALALDELNPLSSETWFDNWQ